METSFRQRLIKIVTFLGGIYFFLEFILPQSILDGIGITEHHDTISYGFIVFASMAVGLGIINLFMVHGSRIIFRRKGWAFSIVLLFGLMTMMTLTTLDWLAGLRIAREMKEISLLADFSRVIEKDLAEKTPNVPEFSFRVERLLVVAAERIEEVEREALSEEQLRNDENAQGVKRKLIVDYRDQLGSNVQDAQVAIHFLQGASSDEEMRTRLATIAEPLNTLAASYGKLARSRHELSLVKSLYSLFFDGLFVSLGSAMFSLLGVYIAAAAYRAFRIRTFESSLMMIAAILVMLGQIPFYAFISDDLPGIRQWLLEVPNSAAFRAIKIGAAVAGLIMAFRMWFSIESGSFTEKRDEA